MGIVEWIVALSFAIARANLGWTKVRLITARFHTALFEVVLLWVLFPVLLGLMHANLSGYSIAIADVAVIGIAVLTWVVNRQTTKAAQRAGIVTLATLILLAGFLAARPDKTEFANQVAVRIYGLAQIAAAILITCTAVELLILAARHELTFAGAMARLAFAYLPLALLSALGSCIWAVTLNIVVRLRHPAIVDHSWQMMFGNLGYDLKSVEWAMAGVTGALGFFVIVATVTYHFTDPDKQAREAHRAIYGALILTPLLLSVPLGTNSRFFRIPEMAFSSFSGVMVPFSKYPAAPSWMSFWLFCSDRLLIANTGISDVEGVCFNFRSTSTPSISGMSMSRRIMLGLQLSAAKSPVLPSQAMRTR
jgi:hypothetical protein